MSQDFSPWRDRPFRRFWAAQSISQFGDRITELAAIPVRPGPVLYLALEDHPPPPEGSGSDLAELELVDPYTGGPADPTSST